MTQTTRNRRVALWLMLLVGGMAGLAYASVPLYQLFCQVTGYGGTPQRVDSGQVDSGGADSGRADHILERRMNIRFDASTHRDLPWIFEPVQRQIDIPVGESGLAFYRAKNTSDRPVRGVATFNVTPLKTGPYFVKVDCFCFTEQTLLPGQTVDMPVTFYIDPAIDDDNTLDEVQTITLSYTFFRGDDPDPTTDTSSTTDAGPITDNTTQQKDRS